MPPKLYNLEKIYIIVYNKILPFYHMIHVEHHVY